MVKNVFIIRRQYMICRYQNILDISRLDIIQISLWILLFFFCDFLGSKCFNTSRPKFVNTLRPKCVNFSWSNSYNGNIRTFWHRKLWMKTWYSSKSLWILSIPCMLFWAQNVWIPLDENESSLFASNIYIIIYIYVSYISYI